MGKVVTTRDAVLFYEKYGRRRGVLTRDERVFMLNARNIIYGPCHKRKLCPADAARVILLGQQCYDYGIQTGEL